jgi:hypothetical protein
VHTLVRWAAGTMVATVVLALGGPGALLPLKAAAQAVTEVSVAFVVDFSGSGGVQSACVKVPSTDDEYQALALFTAQEHEAAPTYNSSGLLCSIGGVPSTGCGQAVGRQYIYWSYWHGDSGSWQYSNTGASGIVHACDAQGNDCDVEGWKFEDPGAGNPTDPPPSVAPDYASICSATSATTTTAAATATTSPRSSATGSGSGSPSVAGAPSSSPSSSTPGPSTSGTGGGGTGSGSTATSAAGATPGTLAMTGAGPALGGAGVLGLVLAALGAVLVLIEGRIRRALGGGGATGDTEE